ncbi:hypothetical protein PU630_13900 [Microbacterium horticulturae]|uniref:Uncharacterized protein n=1 Tax=Microbacterium horticulturae TaxID=3028316 RepID=A0ABY8BVV7_9MICO|nr:hypothetical protein [Microbacterium sp. KACC 23027]WEG08319.1 hypothetical protein PU630_13900 [Microbacterium sp. KACC 23027]
MKTKSIVFLSLGAALALSAGLASGAAIGGIQPDTAPPPTPTPVAYPENSNGLTFGSAMDAPSPDFEPDLIRVEATNGREGYVYKSDLDEADGSAAAESFKSPDEAVAWQEEREAQELRDGPLAVAVYAEDGKTVIGKFEISIAEVEVK